MKRNTFFAIFFLAAATMSAQEKMISVFPEHRPIPESILNLEGKRMPSTDVTVQENPNFTVEVQEGVAPALAPRRAKADTVAGYTNPAGTLFTGYTSTGANTFIQRPAIVGAWSYDLDCWRWENTTGGSYKSIEYQTLFSARYGESLEGAYYHTDDQYNFCDSLLARGGYDGSNTADAEGDYGYFWQLATPLQIVHRNGRDEKFMLLTKYTDDQKLDSSMCAFAAGGLPTGNTADGMWPLTNAVSTNKNGTSTLLTYTAADKKKYYYFGTSLEEGIRPTTIITHYDKPQRQLFVKSITLLLGSNGTINLNALHVKVITESGRVVAESTAAKADLVTVRSPSGRLLTFSFEKRTAYDELLSEGFAVNEPFRVEITGMEDTDNFGLYCAASTVHESKSEMLLANGTTKKVDYDPYIMLNGIYPTLEDYLKGEDPDVETGQVGDTIPVKFNPTEGLTYCYGATYATNEDYDGITEFAFRSTFKPYDETTRYWTFDIERPDYITMTADYEYQISDGTNTGGEIYTYWTYYRLFTLYIYADRTPVVGDCIKIGKYGKNIVFRIDEVKTLEDLNKVSARKTLRNGNIEIERGGKRYNVQGLLIK